MEVDYIFFGWGWSGEVKKLEYSPGTIKSTTKPSMGSVGPNGTRPGDYRPGFADYQVSEFLAANGRTYLLAIAGEAPANDIDAIIQGTYPPPTPFK